MVNTFMLVPSPRVSVLPLSTDIVGEFDPTIVIEWCPPVLIIVVFAVI